MVRFEFPDMDVSGARGGRLLRRAPRSEHMSTDANGDAAVIAIHTESGPDDLKADDCRENVPSLVAQPQADEEAHSVERQDILTVIGELEDELVRCEEMRSASERRAAEAGEQARVAERRNQKLRNHIKAMQKKIATMENGSNAAINHDSAAMKQTTEQLRSENAALVQDRNRLESELGAARERIESADAARNQAQQISLTAGKRCDRLGSEVEALRATATKAGSSLKDLAAQRDKAAGQLKQVCGALESARASQKTAVARAEASDKRAAALEAELEETKAVKARIERQLSDVSATRDRLRSDLDEMGQVLSKESAARSASNADVLSMKSRLDKMQGERTEFMRKLNQTDGVLCETRVERDRLSEQLNEVQAALHDTNSAKAAAERELRHQGHRVDELVDGAEELNVTLRRTEADLNGVAAQRDQLRAQLEASHGELVDAKAARQDAESSAAAKSERLNHLQAVIDDAIARQIDSIKGENASLSGRVEELERQSAALAEQKSNCDSELHALREDKRAAQGNLEQMRTAVSDFNAVLTTAGSRFARTMEAELAGGSAALPASTETKDVQTPSAGDGPSIR